LQELLEQLILEEEVVVQVMVLVQVAGGKGVVILSMPLQVFQEQQQVLQQNLHQEKKF
jgi:hypothetical protein